jgi:hypothetical protein
MIKAVRYKVTSHDVSSLAIGALKWDFLVTIRRRRNLQEKP